MKKLTKEQKKLIGLVQEERRPYEGIWQDIARYFNPYRENLFAKSYYKASVGQHFYNPIGADSAGTMAEGLFGYLMSPAIDWFRLKTDSDRVEDKEWIDEATARIYATLKESNYYSEVISLLLDGLTIGTGVLYFEENLGGHTIYFRSIIPGLIWVKENYHKEITTVVRRDYLSESQVEEKFGIKTHGARNPFLHIVTPHGEKWDSIWVNEKRDEVVKEGSYDYFPYVIWRCIKNPSGAYGFSPSYLALPVVKSLNKMRKTLLQAGELAVKPPLNVPVNADIDLSPNGLNYFSDPSQQITPVNLVGNFPISEEREAAMEKEVRDFFNIDYFLMFAQETKTMSATEVMERQGEKAAVLGNLIGRLVKVLDKVIQGAFTLEAEAGRISQPPEDLNTVEIQYLGPLAIAQQKLFKTKGVNEMIASVAPLIQLSPESATNIDWDYLIRYTVQATDAPARSLLPVDKVRDLKAMNAAKEALTQQGATTAPQTTGLPGIGE